MAQPIRESLPTPSNVNTAEEFLNAAPSSGPAIPPLTVIPEMSTAPLALLAVLSAVLEVQSLTKWRVPTTSAALVTVGTLAS